MPGCCGGATCACAVIAGAHGIVTGTGQAGDPFVIGADVALSVTDSTDFDFTLSGSGTAASPWTISLAYAATAKLKDIPDVNATAPTNGQVLSWNSASSKWVPAAPTTAASGSVQHGNGLTGDGSVGLPLNPVMNTARYGFVDVSGIGLTNAAINAMIFSFTDATARAAMAIAPDLNTITMLDNNPGHAQYWDGTQWSDLIGAFDLVQSGGEFLSLSGSYSGQRLTHFLGQVSAVTDASANFDVLTVGQLSGRIGVLSVMIQETGAIGYKAVAFPNTDHISATAYRLSDGSPLAGQAVTAMVDAWLY